MPLLHEKPAPPGNSGEQSKDLTGAESEQTRQSIAESGARAERRPLEADRGPHSLPSDQRAAKPEVHPSRKSLLRRRPFLVAAVIIAALAILIGGVIWYLHSLGYASTDDAFIDARTVPISAQVSGAIEDVPVTDNQRVQPGAVLVRIDNRDYKAALDQAKAQVDQAKAQIANFEAQIDAQTARIAQAQRQASEAESALTFSRQQNVRAQNLLRTGAGTVQNAQQTVSDLQQKQAALEAARYNVTATQKQGDVLATQLKAARAQLEQARATREIALVNLSRTAVKAPVEGRVANLTAAKGAYAQPGQALMIFVPSQLWVTANFKETELGDMRPGQSATITIDAYPGRVFKGHVQSIQAGSGTAFSLLPPENATGNFVKIVQRVPVKIVFNAPPGVYLGPGMSVVPTVKLR